MPDDSSYDLIQFVTEPSPCPYIASESAQLEYRVPSKLDTKSLEELIERGWRRFGNYVFRPQCMACRKCRPLRVVLEKFRPSKSQRRALKKNEHVEVHVTRPQVTDEHVQLFNAYHRDMSERFKRPARLPIRFKITMRHSSAVRMSSPGNFNTETTDD